MGGAARRLGGNLWEVLGVLLLVAASSYGPLSLPQPQSPHPYSCKRSPKPPPSTRCRCPLHATLQLRHQPHPTTPSTKAISLTLLRLQLN